MTITAQESYQLALTHDEWQGLVASLLPLALLSISLCWCGRHGCSLQTSNT